MIWWLGIVGGTPAPAGRYPDIVALNGRDGELCTGTLIADEWVLTAGHCTNMRTAWVGATDFTLDGEEIAVVEQFIHDEPRVTYDVSLLRLEHAPAGATPRTLVSGCLAGFYQNGTDVTVAGFGRLNLEANEITTQLHEVTVPIVDADCSEDGRGCREVVSPGGELRAGGDGSDSCAGDSGGPLYLDVDGERYLAATVSRSSTPFDTPCGDGGIYVRTDAILPWIRETTGLPFADPTCDGINLPPTAPAIRLTISQGATVDIVPEVSDPDPSDQHVVELATEPLVGRFDGSTYQADPFQIGRDEFALRVTDDGVPPRSIEIPVVIETVPAGFLEEPVGSGGCANAPLPRRSWLDVLRRR